MPLSPTNCCVDQAKDFSIRTLPEWARRMYGKDWSLGPVLSELTWRDNAAHIFCPPLLSGLVGVRTWHLREPDGPSYQGQTSVAHCDKSCWLLTSWFMQNACGQILNICFQDIMLHFIRRGRYGSLLPHLHKGAIEDEMVGWHHQLNGHMCEQTLGDSEGQGSLESSSWGCKSVGHNWATEQQQQHPHKNALQAQWDTSLVNWFMSSASLL